MQKISLTVIVLLNVFNGALLCSEDAGIKKRSYSCPNPRIEQNGKSPEMPIPVTQQAHSCRYPQVSDDFAHIFAMWDQLRQPPQKKDIQSVEENQHKEDLDSDCEDYQLDFIDIESEDELLNRVDKKIEGDSLLGRLSEDELLFNIDDLK